MITAGPTVVVTGTLPSGRRITLPCSTKAEAERAEQFVREQGGEPTRQPRA